MFPGALNNISTLYLGNIFPLSFLINSTDLCYFNNLFNLTYFYDLASIFLFWINEYFSLFTPSVYNSQTLLATLNNSSNIDLGFKSKITLSLGQISTIHYVVSAYLFLYLFISIIIYLININSKELKFFLVTSTILQKVNDLSEQEYGSFDDFQVILVYLFCVFAMYGWIIFSWTILNVNSGGWVFSSILIMTIFLISLPIRLLFDMGVSFLMYIRGSSNSSNFLVELVFDFIGVTIVFTRFILQNIRLVLVFLAYFELFEWVVSGADFNIFLTNIYLNHNQTSIFLYTSDYSFLSFIIGYFKLIMGYLYHLLHLIIVSFVQIGTYLLISFWLFFFLYTSSHKVMLDNYFFKIRN